MFMIVTLSKCHAKFINEICTILETRKKSEMLKIVQIELSVNSKTTRSQI